MVQNGKNLFLMVLYGLKGQIGQKSSKLKEGFIKCDLLKRIVVRSTSFFLSIVRRKNILAFFKGMRYSKLFQGEDVDPFAMPTWRKILWSIFFFMMVATADIGNMIGEWWRK